MESLEVELNHLISSSMAEKTWKTYRTAAESLHSFRSQINLPDIWPVPLNDLLFYIAHLSLQGRSYSSVLTYLSGISYFHKIHNLPDPTKSFLVSKTVEGLKRNNPPKADTRVPISLALLKRIILSLPHICTSSYESVMFASAFSLCFFALLRVGEVTSDSKHDEGVHTLKGNDISFIDNDLHLHIKSSKSDQVGKSTTLIILGQSDEIICPVRLLRKYVKIRHPSKVTNLFIHFDGSNLTRYQFSSILQKSLSFCEVGGHFRSHSFRIGGCTEAKKAGIDDETIKIWGRWKSNAFSRYIRLKFS